MMYKLLKTISPVHRVFIDKYNKSICLWKYFEKKSGLSVLDENLDETEIIREEDNIRFSNVKPSKNFYWLNTGRGGSFRISKSDDSTENKELIVSDTLKDELILTNIKEGDSGNLYYLHCYNEIEDKSIWKQNFSSSRMITKSGIVFCVPGYSNISSSSNIPCNQIILALDEKTGRVLWKHEEDIGYSLEEFIALNKRIFPVKIKRLLGVYNDVLWLGIEKSELVGLDSNTGKEIYRSHIGEDDPDSFYSIQNVYLDEEKGLIVGLAGTHYWEIDLTTMKLTNWDLDHEFLSKKLRCMFTSSSIYFIDKYIYFMSSERFRNDLSDTWQIAVFNRITKKIEWNYAFNLEEGSFLTSFTATENDLFAIDWNKNLYVFKRES